MFILLSVHFLAGFFLLNCFLIPPKHFFPIGRLLLWFGLGTIGFKEGYADVITWNTYERKEHPVEGRYRWLSVGILICETVCSYKYREGTGNLLDNPTPLYISIPWSIFFAWMALTWLYLRFKPGHTVKHLENPPSSTSAEKSPSKN